MLVLPTEPAAPDTPWSLQKRDLDEATRYPAAALGGLRIGDSQERVGIDALHETVTERVE